MHGPDRVRRFWHRFTSASALRKKHKKGTRWNCRVCRKRSGPLRCATHVSLRTLQILTPPAYAGNEEQPRSQFERVVTTYQPAGRHGSEHKGEAFEKQMELVEHKEAQREGTPRRHEGRRGNYGARSLPRHEAAGKE